jgi:tetratricopeptide (TPR) repeat protein
LALARLELDAGRPSAALAQLDAIVPALGAAGAQGRSWDAHARLARGEALLALGNARAAAASLAEVVELREAILWSGSAELALARERLGEARLAVGDPAGRALVEGALPTLRAELGQVHVETRRAERALAAR